MSESALPSLPRGWAWTPLGDLADVKLGKMLSPKAFEPGLRQLPYLRNENVRWFTIDTDDVKLMGFSDEEREKFQLRLGDLLVCEGGEPGRCAVVTESTAHFMIQKALHRVRPRDGAVDARFLQYFFKRFIDAGTVIERRSETTIQHLPREKMLRVPVPLAPPSEQIRIVAKIEELFSDLDAGVAALERAKANLKRYRAAVLKAAVEGRLTEEWRTRHPATEPAAKLLERILAERRAKWEQDQLRKFKEAGKTPPKGWRERYEEPCPPDTARLAYTIRVPDQWPVVSAEQVALLSLGKMLDREKHQSGQLLPYLRNVNVRWGHVDMSDLNEMYFESHELDRFGLLPGDVLVCEGGEPGRAAVWTGVTSQMTFQKAIHRVRCSSHLDGNFLVMLLEDYARSGRLERFFTGSTIKHFTGEAFSTLPVPLPPLTEQVEIVAEVDRRLSVANAAETQVEHALQRAARLRQAILKHAFEGKLVPQDPTDEPAAALLDRIKPATNGKHLGPAKPPIRRSRSRV